MAFTKISVLVPTRHRVKRLRTLLDSFHETTSVINQRAELVFRIDDDDPESAQFLHGHKRVIGPRLNGYGSMPAFFNEMANVADGDVLMLGNDDMVFKTSGWSGLVLEAANCFPDGLFDIGVNTLNETHFPFSIVSRAAVNVLGFVWDPRVFWGDIFWRDTMASFDRAVRLQSVEIAHDWAGWNADKVFAESDKDIISKDPTYWTVTHANAVSEAVSKLRALQ